MTEVVRLPERVDSTTVDVEELVGRVESGELTLDWEGVEDADPDTVRRLFEPFEEGLDRWSDALGIWTMTDAVEPVVNWVLGEGPEPAPTSWLFLQGEESQYVDERGRHYEFSGSMPNGRSVEAGHDFVLARPSAEASDGRRIFGVGSIDEIVPVQDDRFRAVFGEYDEIAPALAFDDVGGDPRPNPSNSINRIPFGFVKRVRDTLQGPSTVREVEAGRAGFEEESFTEQSRCRPPDMDLDNGSDVRKALHRIIELDLLGPACGPEEELLEDPPRTRYVVGTLTPKDAEIDPTAQDDPLGGAGEESEGEGDSEPSRPLSHTLFASSIGMTFAVDADVEAVRVRATWGAYDRVQSDVHETDLGNPRMVWKRRTRGGTLDLDLEPGRVDVVPDQDAPKVRVRGVVREPTSDGTVLVTLFLVNDQTTERGEVNKDRKWVFQPEIVVERVEEDAPFVRRQPVGEFDPSDGDLEEEERAMLAMVHRKHADFAVGHGVGVHADPAGDPWTDASGWDRAVRVRTAVMPFYDVPVTEPPGHDELAEEFEGFEGFELDMKTLAEMPRDDLVAVLRRIPETYGRWIEGERERLRNSPDLNAHEAAAELALEAAERARSRLQDGVECIGRNDVALEAFRFANRAMRLQRLRSVFARRRRRGEDVTFEEVEQEEPAAWRLFQLAFIVLNIPTVVELDHPRRTSDVASYADLLWFPTGGGKTEAYLGVAALSVAVRRLQGEVEGYGGDGGVTVIMRYTLRLLTLQQFQRAATLVCALEHLRKSENESGDRPWGEEPFRIGLWVGGRATPNWTSKARQWVEQHMGNATWDASAGSSSPLQLTNCPWCGSKLGPENLRVEEYSGGRGRTFLFCPDRGCEFNRRRSPGEGIPVVTVDEEIYRLVPTFLLATVDKFAQMPWRGEVQALFGRVEGRCPRHGWLGTEAECRGAHHATGSLPATEPASVPTDGLRPPDLVIQDELHLISGPLGTLVGLYETAIDELCEWRVGVETVRPKVIASTATTRRAPEQVHRLFSRQVEIFPPTGLDASDDFFSRQRPPRGEKPGRRYVGVCAPGRSRASVLIRMYVAALTAAEWLWHEVDDDKKGLVDPYMTLLGYFNSLRELGGMRRLIDDDVDTRAFRIEREDRPGLKQRKLYPESTVQELTSRVRSSRIPEILDQLDDTFTRKRDPDVPKAEEGRPLDIVLATNMVSVGVDVQRLGLMVVSGQPKATAEYIQATSRVGRSVERPGLVLTMLNWARPRDLSHYEQFEQYHAVFYKHVEALSVTPFAPRALDRGLMGVLASLVRLDQAKYNPNLAAEKVQGAGDFPRIIDSIASRARNSSDLDGSGADIEQRVRRAVAAKLDAWGAEAAKKDRRLGYREPRGRDDVTVPLLQSPGSDPWGPFTVAHSMREVEPGVGLIFGNDASDDLPDWEFRSSETEAEEPS